MLAGPSAVHHCSCSCDFQILSKSVDRLAKSFFVTSNDTLQEFQETAARLVNYLSRSAEACNNLCPNQMNEISGQLMLNEIKVSSVCNIQLQH